MKVKMIRSLESWLENGDVQNVIDSAEESTGYRASTYKEYDCFVDSLRLKIEAAICDAGHDVDWAYQQSVGVGAILQGPWLGTDVKEQQEAIFDAAFNECQQAFAADCEAYCRVELDAGSDK